MRISDWSSDVCSSDLPMSSEHLHAPRERLSKKTLAMHHAIVSLMEELEAADWYRQRADDCEDDALKAILLHTMRADIEHAAMVLDWLRRTDADFARQMTAYLFAAGAKHAYAACGERVFV